MKPYYCFDEYGGIFSLTNYISTKVRRTKKQYNHYISYMENNICYQYEIGYDAFDSIEGVKENYIIRRKEFIEELKRDLDKAEHDVCDVLNDKIVIVEKIVKG